MDPLMSAAALGGLGLIQGMTTDRWKEDRQRWLASQTQRYSPWTGLRAGAIEEADPLGKTMQGGVSGYAQGQEFNRADAGNKLMEAQTKYYNALGPSQNAPGASFEGEYNWQPYGKKKSPWSMNG